MEKRGIEPRSLFQQETILSNSKNDLIYVLYQLSYFPDGICYDLLSIYPCSFSRIYMWSDVTESL